MSLYLRPFAVVLGIAGVLAAETVQTFPPWFPKAPSLPPPRGETIRASTADELLAASDRIGPGGTILLTDGHYRLPRVMVLAGKRDIANIAGQQPMYVSEGHIRNNFIVGGPDCGIELWYADRVKVYNNSIWRPDRNWHRGIRIGTGTTRTEIMNNLVHGEIRLEGGKARLRHNLADRLDGYFVDPASGNLSLTSAALRAIDGGVTLPDLTEDIRGRPRRGAVDIGAWESDVQDVRSGRRGYGSGRF